jgi:chloramphenicol 3-O phosphotransferase
MLIVLSGTSSSGKTSLARAMQRLSPRPLLHIEADRFAPAAPERVASDPDFRRRAVIAMHDAIAAYGKSGLEVIVDGSLPTERDLRDACLSVLRGVPGTRIVAVRCSVERLRQREAARSHPAPGWAEQSIPLVYDGVEFDLAVDTTDCSPEEAARELLAALFGPAR